MTAENREGMMTEGFGRLPEPGEMADRLGKAGIVGAIARSRVPGESFFSFVARNR